MATKHKTTADQKAETAVYEVTSPLEVDQVRYAIGDTVELSAAQAAPLLGHTVQPVGADQADPAG